MSRSLSRSQALALATAAALAPTLARAQTPTIRIATGLADSYAVPLYANDGGFFTRAGLNVALTLLPNGGAVSQAIAGNAVDVGIADVTNVANSAIAGVPLAFFAGGGLYLSSAPTTLLFVDKNSTLRTAKDLSGQTVAVVALASISSLGVREWLRKGGADVDSVKLIELPYAQMIPSLQRGQIGAALLSEPFIADFRDQTRLLGKAFDAIADSFYISGWIASRDWLGKNPDLLGKLRAAAYDAARWANTHHDDTAPIFAKYAKLTLDRIRSMTRVTFATSLDARQIQPVLDVAFRYGQIQRQTRAADIMV